LLGTELWVVDVEIKNLIGAGVGVRVGGEQHVTVVEGATSPNLEGVVVVLTSVLEDEVPVGSHGVSEIVGQAVDATLLDVFGLEIDVRREFAFKSNAPVHEPGSLQRVRVSRKSGGDGAGDQPVGREERVLASAALRTSDEKDRSGIVKEPNPGGKLGFAGVVQNVRGGEPRRDQGVTNDLVPVIAGPCLDKEAAGGKPAVLHVSANFGVVRGGGWGSREGGVAGAGRRREGKTAADGRTGLTFLQIHNRLAKKAGVVAEAVEINAELEIVLAMPVARPKIQIG